MKYSDFEHALSIPRTQRYLLACGGDKVKTMTLYRLNMQLTHELFSVVSVLEISLRNALDREMRRIYGNNWLVDALNPVTGALCVNRSTRESYSIINNAFLKLDQANRTQDNLIPKLEFGVWHHMFAAPQYAAFGHNGLNIFSELRRRNPGLTRNNVFDMLTDVNELRNRLAHHEPVCFQANQPIKDTTYARSLYSTLTDLIDGMGLETRKVLYGIDHVLAICDKIDTL